MAKHTENNNCFLAVLFISRTSNSMKIIHYLRNLSRAPASMTTANKMWGEYAEGKLWSLKPNDID